MKVFRARHAFIDGRFVENYIFAVENGFFVKPPENSLPDEELGTVVPGFIDAHTHMWQYGIFVSRPNLRDTKSIDEALLFISETLKGGGYSPPVIFEEFDQSRWKENRFITRKELDSVTGDIPVILRRVCGHIAIANSAALKLLPRRTPGVDGKTGLLIEEVPLKINEYFPPQFEEIKLGILTAQEEMLSLGITSVHEFGNSRVFRAYQELDTAGLLKIRVYFNFYLEEMDKLEKMGILSSFGNERLRIGGIKVFADGSVGGKTASFFQNYVGEKTAGKLFYDVNLMGSIVRRAQEAGLQLLIHAIGTRAIRTVLHAFKDYLPGGNHLRHRIEHFEFPEDYDIKLARAMGILISSQPNFVKRWGGPDGMYRHYLGENRWKLNNPFKKMLLNGLKVAFGSDAMPPSPSYGISGAVGHLIEEYAITFEEAMNLYTGQGAYFSFEEHIKGEIKPGMLADFVEIDGAKEGFKVQSTFINGTRVSG